jgi:hypothetical protein
MFCLLYGFIQKDKIKKHAKTTYVNKGPVINNGGRGGAVGEKRGAASTIFA